MAMRRLLCATLALTACTQGGSGPTLDGVIQDGTAVTPIFEKPEGYPYPLGDLSGSIGPGGVSLKSYDYSVGAIDPNVWVQNLAFHATFERADDPLAFGPVLTLTGIAPGPLTKGMRFPVIAELARENGTTNPVVLRSNPDATLQVTVFSEGGSGAYDRITALVTGEMCPPKGGTCQPMALRFDTEVYQNDW